MRKFEKTTSRAMTDLVVLRCRYSNRTELRKQLSQVLRAVEPGALSVTASVRWRNSKGR